MVNMDMTDRSGLSGGNGSLLFPSGSLLFPLLVGYLSGCQRGGVGHMDAEEKLQCLAVSVARRYAHQVVVLLLIAETSLHDGGTEIAYYTSCSSEIRLFIPWCRSLAYEAGEDFVFSAVSAIFVVGINCICAYSSGIQSGQFLMIFHRGLQPDTLVEGLERVMLYEGDAVDLYAIHLCPELHPLVLLPSDNGTDIRPVYADNTVFDMLPTEMAVLLVKHMAACRQPLVLLCGQKNQSSRELVESVPFPQKFFQQMQQSAHELTGLGLAGLALFGVCQTRFVDIMVFTTRHRLSHHTGFLHQKAIHPFTAFPQQLDVGGIPEMALITGGIGKEHVLVGQFRTPLPVQELLASLDVKIRGKTVADGAHYLSVLYWIRRIYENPAEHLHVQAAIEHLYQSVIRQTRIRLEKHQCNLAFRGEDRLVPTGILPGHPPSDLIGNLPERQKFMDTTKLTEFKALTIFLKKIEFCERQSCRNIGYFL